MLDSSQLYTFGGYKVGVLLVQIDSGLSMLSSVVAKYKEIKGLDAAIGIFTTSSDRCMVIGCTGAQDIDIGGIMRKLGGGGHTGAGSAMVRSEDAESVRHKVIELIADQMNGPRTGVRDIMSQPEAFVPSTTPLREARSMVERARSGAVLVLDDGRFSGLVSREECSKAKTDSQLRAPVKAFMRTKVPLIHPDDLPREALRLMTEAETAVLPVVEDGRLVGVVTRTDLMLHIYEF
jgi:CBS domain-containing protein